MERFGFYFANCGIKMKRVKASFFSQNALRRDQEPVKEILIYA
jgi:hypothetical protein